MYVTVAIILSSVPATQAHPEVYAVTHFVHGEGDLGIQLLGRHWMKKGSNIE
jgi:hypothetical protein